MGTIFGTGTLEENPYICGICHRVDHPCGLCPYPGIVGWNRPQKLVSKNTRGRISDTRGGFERNAGQRSNRFNAHA